MEDTRIRLWKRNLWLIYLFYILRGANLYVPFLTALLLAHSFSGPVAMLFTAFGYVMGAVPEIYTGYYADRTRRPHSMILGACTCATSMVILGTLGFVDSQAFTYFQGFAASFLLYVGQSLMTGADSALQVDTLYHLGVPKQVEDKDGRSRGLYGAAEGTVAYITASFALFGVVIGLRWMMFLQAMVYVGAALTASFMTETPRKPHRLTMRQIVVDSWRNPKVAALICLSAAIGSLSGGLVWLTPLYFVAYSGLEVGSGAYGWVYMAIWGTYLMSVMFFETIRFRGHKLRGWLHNLPHIGFGYVIAWATLCYVGVTVSPWVFAMVWIGGTYPIRASAIPIANALLSKAVKEANGEWLATVVSIGRTVQWALTFVSFVLGAAVLKLSGSLRLAVAISGVVIIGFALFSFVLNKRRGTMVSDAK